ncbi:hypothetical protein GGR51DRAFT_537467 [Nemania sp. FL0031]|nr:hypothetical protein GGR51DRAFT_537467 [Nemania sp. FL0031]
MGCRVTSVSIPKGSIGPYIENSKRKIPSIIGQYENDDFQLWSDDDPFEHADNNEGFHTCGSLRAVAVNLLNKSCWKLNVEIEVSSAELLDKKLELYGDNDASVDVIRPGSSPLVFSEIGRHRLSMTVEPPWAATDVPWGLAGNIAWRLQNVGNGKWVGLNSTRLEFYALNHTLPAPFKSNTVPVELLRQVLLPRQMWTPSDTWENYCCRLAFQDFTFQYDVMNGAPLYYALGTETLADGTKKAKGDFKLGMYLNSVGRRKAVNCYDQASAMQVFLLLSPTITAADWMFMEPFGFIHTTVLVGRGACNNPFYKKNGTLPIVRRSVIERTSFRNHAFVHVRRESNSGLKVVDACCGPHTGTEDLNTYITNSIDSKKNWRWRSEPRVDGEVRDARLGWGITEILMGLNTGEGRRVG